MPRQTKSDDRLLGASLVASVFGLVFAGAMFAVGNFGLISSVLVFAGVAAVVFLALFLGWRDPAPTGPGPGKAPTADDSDAGGPARTSTSGTAGSSGTTAAATTGETAVQAAPTPAAPASDTAPETAAEPGTRPATLDGPRDGRADDLKQIKGVGPKLEELCHSLGFYHFDQIAGWTAEEVAWVDQNLEGFKGRVSRDDWVAQARALAAGGSTEISDTAEKGDVH